MQKISASKIRIIRTCPVKYALTYGSKLIDLDVPKVETEYNFYRNVVCNAFSEFYKKNFKNDKSFANYGQYHINVHMKELAKEGKELIFADVKNFEYVSKSRKVLERFYQENINEDRNNIEVNRHVSVFMKNNIYDIILNGVIDFVKHNDIILIRDYKMGARKGDEFDIEKDPQLGIYSLAIEMLEKKRPVIESYIPGYDNVKTDRKKNQFSDEEHKRVKEIIIETFDKMNELNIRLVKKQKIEPHYSEHCRFCNHTYSGACDKYTKEGWLDTMDGTAVKISIVNREKDEEIQKTSKKKKIKKDKNQYVLKFGEPGDEPVMDLKPEQPGQDYKIELPEIQIPEIRLPEIQLPEIILPQIQMSDKKCACSLSCLCTAQKKSWCTRTLMHPRWRCAAALPALLCTSPAGTSVTCQQQCRLCSTLLCSRICLFSVPRIKCLQLARPRELSLSALLRIFFP
ncbi:PD-(D/E)XK nuclease family protein [archaeon]|nr:PD-(D/E)XK nuclease family protein [archaeon]